MLEHRYAVKFGNIGKKLINARICQLVGSRIQDSHKQKKTLHGIETTQTFICKLKISRINQKYLKKPFEINVMRKFLN